MAAAQSTRGVCPSPHRTWGMYFGCSYASLCPAAALPHGSISHIRACEMMLGSVQAKDPNKSLQTLPGKATSNAHRLQTLSKTLQDKLSGTSFCKTSHLFILTEMDTWDTWGKWALRPGTCNSWQLCLSGPLGSSHSSTS